MIFPLGVWDLSLLLAIMSTVLLITSEMLSLHYSKVNIPISRRKLRQAAIIVTVLFLITLAIRVINIVLIP